MAAVDQKNICITAESSQTEDVRELIELLKGLDEKSRQRTMGYMDALRTLGGQLAQSA